MNLLFYQETGKNKCRPVTAFIVSDSLLGRTFPSIFER
jgi:hypothetical protein